jgi:peptide/nickel transport system substrate-binding protein
VGALAAGLAYAQVDRGGAPAVDRNATLRFAWVAAPAAYDPPFAKNQFQETAYGFLLYDMLVRADAKGDIAPSLATSWSLSPDGLTLTMKLRSDVKFSDGSPFNAAAAARSLRRTKTDPQSVLAGQLASFESFDAPDPTTLVIRLNKPDGAALYALATSAGFIVSAKALDDNVKLALNPVGSGPYRLVSSGPQGATYERNEDYFDKSANQLARVVVSPIVDNTARLNALRTGQIDAGLFQVDQWPQIQELVNSGRFFVHGVIGPNSLPIYLNTKIKPLDNPKVRMALNLAIDRDAINQGIQNGRCPPANQPIPPGVIGHDAQLPRYPKDIAKAKALLAEAGVPSFSFDAIVSVQEPMSSVALAVKQQLQAIGVTMNIQTAASSAARPMFRQGGFGGLGQPLSAVAPDPATIIDTLYMGPDNPGGVTPEFAKAVAAARALPVGSAERDAAYRTISRMARDNPHQILVCWSPSLVVARRGVLGVEKQAYLNAVSIPDLRTYAIAKSPGS